MWFPEKTPEESDDSKTWEQTRPKSEKLGENNQLFSPRFEQESEEYSIPG